MGSRQGWLGSVAIGLFLAGPAAAQLGPGTVAGIWKLSQTRGGVMPVLDDDDQLGRSVAVLGDLDGNGTVDLASAGLGDDDGGIDQGAAYVIFLRQDGRALRTQKISALAGGFTGDLDPGDQFGRSMATIGDLDGDGLPDLAVGANYDDDGGMNRGAVYVLNLRADGTVRRTSKISSLAGGFAGPLRNNDEFGRAIAPLGDLDGDGVLDIAVGAPTDSTGGTRRGAVWILFLRPDGSVKRSQKIASGTGGFGGRLRNLDWFGFSLANLGDFDGDGVTDLAVGAALDDDGAVNAGAVWLLYLRRDGTVKDQRKISMLSGGFQGLLESPDQFGTSVARVGDLNGDGITELAVGAVKDGDGGRERGAAYILFLTPQGTVAFHQKISSTEGGFPARQIDNVDWFGSSLAPLGDFNLDGVPDLAIGARNDDDGGPNHGAVYLTYLKGSSLALASTSANSHVRVAREVATSARATLTPGCIRWVGKDESDGSLELLELGGASGDRVRLRLPMPADFGEGDATVLLLASGAALDDAAAGALALDGRAGLLRVFTATGSDSPEVELVVDPARRLVLQALWISNDRRAWSEALDLNAMNYLMHDREGISVR